MHGPNIEAVAPLLREELTRRQTQRVRRRRWLRWRRHRLLVKLIATERELANASEKRQARLRRKANRIAVRLAKNARRAFR